MLLRCPVTAWCARSCLLWLLPPILVLMAAATSCTGTRLKSVTPLQTDEAGPSAEVDSRQGRMVALIIGNNAYSSVPLPTSVNDARVMEGVLRGAGFQVLKQTDVKRKMFRQLVREFSDLVLRTPGAVAVFYYSGHGVQVNGRNYMIPIDADISNEADVEDDGVPLDNILARLDMAKSSPNIVILDACRNNPFEKKLKGFQKGLATTGAPPGTLIAYATSPNKVAQSGPQGGVSPFTFVLAQEMNVPGADILAVFKATARRVIELTRGEQTPYLEMPAYFPEFSFRQASSPVVGLPPAGIPAGPLPRDHPPAVPPSPF